MHEILGVLSADTVVLDLGCQDGSFQAAVTSAVVVRADLEAPKRPRDRSRFVRCDAASLPFRDRIFAAVISSHSLEHFSDVAAALREIGRVIRRDGSLFVAVPDSSTITDRIYRWLGRGGGHVNAFRSAETIVAAVVTATGLPHAGTRVLYSSLSFLNRRNARAPWPRRIWLLGGGFEWTLFLYAWLSRRLDRSLGTRVSIYGWAIYFGDALPAIDPQAWINVCIRCGSGFPASALTPTRLVGVRAYRCPRCGARNPYADAC